MTTAVLDDADQLGEVRAPASAMAIADNVRGEVLVDRGHRARARRRRVDGRGPKLAFARSGRCLSGRRASEPVKPQVTSSVDALAAGSRGWVVCLYDPTTGTFLTRDPANASTSTTQGNPYHYVGNDPLNRVDPEGLRASDPDFTPPPPPEPEVVDPDCATFNDHGESTDTSPSMGQFRVDCGVVKKILDRYLPVWRSHKVPIHTSYCNNDGSDMTIGLSGTASFCASWTALNVDWLKGDSIYHRMTGSLWDAYQFTVIHEYAHVVILSVGEIGLNPNGNNDPFRRYTGNDNAKGWPARDDLDAWADLLREEGGTLDDVGPRLIPYGRDMPLGKSEIVNELLADCIAQDAFSAVRGGYWLKYVPGNTEGCPRRGQLSGYRYVNGGTR